MKKALVIGSSGQDGALLTRLLHNRGYHVTGVSRTLGAARCDTFVELDVANTSRLITLVRELQPDEIYYLAAYHRSSQGSGHPAADENARTFAVNVDGYLAVLDSVLTACRSTRIFYACTSLIYGDAQVAIANEDTPYRPGCLYSIAKLTGLQVSEYHRAQSGLHVSVGILFNHESSYRGSQFLSKRITDGVRDISVHRRDRLVVGDLGARCDWGYAGDYVDAMWRMLQLAEGGTYVVATGELHEVRDWVNHCCGRAGLDPITSVTSNPSILTRSRSALAGDSSRLRAATGWAPQVSFEQLVDKMYDNEF